MAQTPLPPPPLHEPGMPKAWLSWLILLARRVRDPQQIVVDQFDYAGSKLTDIEDRKHNDLQYIDGGQEDEYYHLTYDQHLETTNFFAVTDITGTEAETLTDGSSADSLHKHDSIEAFTVFMS